MHSKTEWGGCYSGLSKKRSFLRLFSPKSFSRQKVLILAPAISALGILVLASALFITSDLTSNTYAIEMTDDPHTSTTESGSYYVTLTAPDVTFSLAPSNGTTSDKAEVSVEVTTNAAGGASLYLGMTGDTTALYPDGDTTSTARNIAGATTETTYDNMVANTWAYSIDDEIYGGVPAASSEADIIANVNGGAVGTESGGVYTGSVPVYFAAKVDTSMPSGSYANSIVYSAIVAGGVETTAELTSITVDGSPVEQLQLDTVNTILVTTNLKTNTYGTPRVYYTTTSPSGYAECGNVVVASNAEGYMTIQCETTPTTVATGLTLHIVPKGSSEDTFCTDGTYEANSSQCEAGDWKWGNFTVTLPDIAAPGPDIDRPATSWDDLEIMQHMTPEICAKAPEGATKQLIDWRDKKTYWVAKLADGNCWMTQNLELDLTSGESLTPELSDVSANWNPGATTFTSAQEGVRGSSYYNTVQSWNLGKYVWKTPNSTSYCQPDTNFSESSCASYWQDASNMTPMTTYRTDGVSVDGNTYDAHYLAGNYYSWEAATAGTGHSYTSSGSQAPDSICPKGFELPLSHTNNNNVSGSFYNLLNQYGFTSSTGSGTNSITRAPLFFVRSGYVYPSSYLGDAGNDGYYWSSVAYSSSYAYTLFFRSSAVGPSDNYRRYYGQSVRCVAPSA